MSVTKAPKGHVAVRSCLATAEMLRDWGFEVAGSVSTHDEWRKGDDIHVARAKARRAGFVFESHWEDHERTWVGSTKNSGCDTELLEWFRSEGSIRRS